MAQDYGLPPELAAEQRRLQRQQEMAEAMLQQSMQPLQTNQMAGGYVVPVSPFQGLAQLANTYVGTRQRREAEKGLEGIGQRYNEGLADAVKRYKAGATVETPPATPNDDEGNPMPMVSTAADPRARVINAIASPYAQVRQLGQMDYQTAQADKKMAAEQTFRAQESQEQRKFRAEEAQANREARMAQIQTQLQSDRLREEDRANLQRELTRMRLEGQRDLRELTAAMRPPQTPVAVMGPDGKPVYVSPDKAVGMSPAGKEASKLPASALKMQQEEIEAIGLASGITADLSALKNQITDGTLKLGPIQNLASKARNYAGASNENSQNFASFQATLEKLRNDSLRLNKGVQTEGDAQRAWNELFSNVNDPKVVSKRLDEIQRLNQRAVDLRKLNVDLIRSNFGVTPMDTSPMERLRPAVGGASGGWGIQRVQ